MARIRVSLVRSLNGRPAEQRATVRALGLTRMHSSAIHDDTPSVRGMVRKVRHLLRVEEAAVAEPAPEAESGGDEEAE
ncbi:50S ribosomal protein L30 [candidate division KD3-62 bacterium DG_56]|uniref:50S ribosomal protein L30 n=1 Tax=candidate division KD3-62 bacterium DG_56 TaxID=1704032 RepID=A0A0S7XR67_9BACT|nr:MAG: 50S ribosomal protein L30 [candidate division KD3-62 bacterium DG_56]